LHRTIRDVMDNRLDIFHTASLSTHISWRINRMKPNRILRKLFPKPAETPNWWSQGIEKYIFIDESESPPYPLVDNVFYMHCYILTGLNYKSIYEFLAQS